MASGANKRGESTMMTNETTIMHCVLDKTPVMATEGQTMGKCVAFNCPICLEQIIKPNFFLVHKHSAGHVCRSTFLETLLEKKLIALISNARSVG